MNTKTSEILSDINDSIDLEKQDIKTADELTLFKCDIAKTLLSEGHLTKEEFADIILALLEE